MITADQSLSAPAPVETKQQDCKVVAGVAKKEVSRWFERGPKGVRRRKAWVVWEESSLPPVL